MILSKFILPTQINMKDDNFKVVCFSELSQTKLKFVCGFYGLMLRFERDGSDTRTVSLGVGW